MYCICVYLYNIHIYILIPLCQLSVTCYRFQGAKQASTTREGRWLPRNSLNFIAHSSSCAVQSGELRLRKMVKGVPCQVRGLTKAEGHALWIWYGLMSCVCLKVIDNLSLSNTRKDDVCILVDTYTMICFTCGYCNVDTCGYMWIHVDTCGYMWIHVDSCGICGCIRLIWIPCIIYAYSWGSPHTSRQAGRVRGQSSAWRALFECQKGTDLVTAFNDYRIVGDK